MEARLIAGAVGELLLGAPGNAQEGDFPIEPRMVAGHRVVSPKAMFSMLGAPRRKH